MSNVQEVLSNKGFGENYQPALCNASVEVNILSKVYGDTEGSNIEVAAIRLSGQGFDYLKTIAAKVAAIIDESFIALEVEAGSRIDFDFIADTDESSLIELIDRTAEQDGEVEIKFTSGNLELVEKVRKTKLLASDACLIEKPLRTEFTETLEAYTGLYHYAVVFISEKEFVLKADYKHSSGTVESVVLNLTELAKFFECQD